MRVTAPPARRPTRWTRGVELALVLASALLYAVWVSHGDLGRAFPGGQSAALGVAAGLVAALATARLALAGAFARLWLSARADPAPLVLAALLLLAAATRVAGAYAPTSRYDALERPALAEADRMLTSGDYRPRTFERPSALLYLQTAAAIPGFLGGVSVDRWRFVQDMRPGDLATPARLLNALLGLLSVALAYRAGERLYGRRAGLLAAALLTASPLAWSTARRATEDALATAACLAALVAIAAASAGRGEHPGAQLPGLLLAALLAGFAAGVRPSLVLLAAPLALAALGRREARPRLWGWALLVAGGVAGFLLAVPYALASVPALLDTAGAAAREYELRVAPVTLALFLRHLPAGIALFAREDPLVALAGGIGVALALYRRQRPDLLLLAFLAPAGVLLVLHRDLDARQFVVFGAVLALLGGRSLAAAWDLAVQQSRPTRHGSRPARTGRGQRAGGSGS